MNDRLPEGCISAQQFCKKAIIHNLNVFQSLRAFPSSQTERLKLDRHRGLEPRTNNPVIMSFALSDELMAAGGPCWI